MIPNKRMSFITHIAINHAFSKSCVQLVSLRGVCYICMSERKTRQKQLSLTMKQRFLLTAVILAVFAFPSGAAEPGDNYRGQGMIARIGIGAPANVEIGIGYQFCPNFALTAEAFSYSGMTAMTGALDARYYMTEKQCSPFLGARLGYGTLGKSVDNQNFNDMFESVTAGISWHRFDLGAGIIYDSFHKAQFIAGLSWTICLKGK